jgi:hypothetical protein
MLDHAHVLGAVHVMSSSECATEERADAEYIEEATGSSEQYRKPRSALDDRSAE